MTRSDLAAEAAQALFPRGTAVAACLIGSAPPAFPTEVAAVATAVPARQAEFAAGRRAARSALTALGRAAVAIPPLESRAPGWPAGVTGSIAHADGLAMAALAPTSIASALGLDIEPDLPFPADLVDEITLPEEREWLSSLADPLTAARLIFVAKEAAYKCQFPSSQSLLDFSAMQITCGPEEQISATFTLDVPPFRKGDRLWGRHTRAAGLLIVGFCLPADATEDAVP